MSVQYLSAEWMATMNDALSADPTMRIYSRDQDTVFHMVISGAPDDLKGYFLHVSDGSSTFTMKEPRTPDVEASMVYDDAVALFKGEMDGGYALATGKIRVADEPAEGIERAIKAGNTLSRIPLVAQKLDIEY